VGSRTLSYTTRLIVSLCLIVPGITVFAGELPRITATVRAHEKSSGQAFLEKRLAVWQQRLKLTDWTVSLELSDRSDLRPGTLGNLHWDPEKKTARIRVLNPSTGEKLSQAELNGIEDIMVHELIHLELSSLPKSDVSRSDEEFAVNHLADALLELDRKEISAQSR
jgi:hypothetical protein